MNVLIITFDPPYGIGGIEKRSRLYFKGLRKKVMTHKFCPSYHSHIILLSKMQRILK
jgi:hypothetical protein